MRIIIADDLSPQATDVLREEHAWTIDARPGRSRAELLEDMKTADALVVRSATKVDRELIEAAPNLKIVARAGTGVDNVDLDAATERGIIVTNAPGANSISVAEHAVALMLSLARSVPRADAAMKAHRWEKKQLVGRELKGKTLGLVGLGRIGQEVARRALAFGMQVVAHDPFIAEHRANEVGVSLVSLDELCERADFISLHIPATDGTQQLFDAARLARCKPGMCLINTARGELIDPDALAAAIESGHLGGAGLDVFHQEPPKDWRLADSARVIATPHIAASTTEAQEQVGFDAVTSVRDYLKAGVVRNAVNFPSIPVEDFARLHPFLTLAERLGACVSQLAVGRPHSIGVRSYGDLTEAPSDLISNAVLVGFLKSLLSTPVTLVNARPVAEGRGLEVIESKSTRRRSFSSLLSVKLHTDQGECWLEGTVFEGGGPRLVLVEGVIVEAPLEGTLLVIKNDDKPGVIGEVGTILGQHGINIATFALGRQDRTAVGVVNLDTTSNAHVTDEALNEIRRRSAIQSVRVVKL